MFSYFHLNTVVCKWKYYNRFMFISKCILKWASIELWGLVVSNNISHLLIFKLFHILYFYIFRYLKSWEEFDIRCCWNNQVPHNVHTLWYIVILLLFCLILFVKDSCVLHVGNKHYSIKRYRQYNVSDCGWFGE